MNMKHSPANKAGDSSSTPDHTTSMESIKFCLFFFHVVATSLQTYACFWLLTNA